MSESEAALVFESVRIGILFNAMVSAIVAGIAFAFVVFLFRRWKTLDLSMRAYAYFWITTMFVWGASATRYVFYGFHLIDQYYGSPAYWSDVMIQAAVFFTGPPVFYYTIVRVFHDPRFARFASLVSLILAFFALSYALAPGGITPPIITAFSADSTITRVPFSIFSGQVILVLSLLMVDIVGRLRRWYQKRDPHFLYHALYSLSIFIYAILGSIDQSKIILDWPLIVFRMLYSGVFLMAYLTIVQHEAFRERYLLEEQIPEQP